MKSSFDFSYTAGGKLESKPVEVRIPLRVHPRELAVMVISQKNLPVFVEDKLTQEIENFAAKELNRWAVEEAGNGVDKARKDEDFCAEILKQWVNAFESETSEFCVRKEVKAEDFVAEIYHQLVHSPAYRELLKHEQNFAIEYEELVKVRDEELSSVGDAQAEELAVALGNMSDAEVNMLTAKHDEVRDMMETEWKTRLDSFRREQRNQLHSWLLAMAELLQMDSMSGIAAQNKEFEAALEPDNEPVHNSRFQESFTIHLGTQMKQSHNLRLVADDVMNLCRLPSRNGTSVSPQRLQMAMSLYSNNLSGLVLLADNRISTMTGNLRKLTALCERLPELHFEPIDEQLDEAVRLSLDGSEWRELKAAAGEPISADSNGYCPSGGDFFVTKHSNLAEIHVIFHLVSDVSVASGDINSRHPVILGIRNILKWSCLNDVRSLAIPLLLVHELSDAMTPNWCIKRAELVFKCVKGFMMEMSSWGVSDAQTLQFLVPSSVDSALFNTLSGMLTTIFRIANPLVLTHKVQ